MAQILTAWGGDVFDFETITSMSTQLHHNIPWTSTQSAALNSITLSGKKYWGGVSGPITYTKQIPAGVTSMEFQFTLATSDLNNDTANIVLKDTGGFKLLQIDKFGGDPGWRLSQTGAVRETVPFTINNPYNFNVRLEETAGDFRCRVWRSGQLVYDYTDTASAGANSFFTGNGGEFMFELKGAAVYARNVAIYSGVTVEAIPKFYELTDRELAPTHLTGGYFAGISGASANGFDNDDTTAITTTGGSFVIPSEKGGDYVADKVMINGRISKASGSPSNTTIVLNRGSGDPGTDLYSGVVDAAHIFPEVGALGILDLGGAQIVEIGGNVGQINRIGFKTP